LAATWFVPVVGASRWHRFGMRCVAGNGELESPLPDARWALDRIGERFGNLPVGLVGHSMGGRVALRVADHRRVCSVAALAPWLPEGEPIPALDDRKVLLAHGTADRTTDPRETSQLAKKLREEGVEVEQHEFIGGHHSMLFPAKPWHHLVARFMVRTLLAPELRCIAAIVRRRPSRLGLFA